MRLPTFGTLRGQIPPVAVTALEDLRTAIGDTQSVVTTLEQAHRMGAPLSLAQLRQIQTSLTSVGQTPLNILNLIGGSSAVLAGTHATRITTPASGNAVIFVETDRGSVYYAKAGVWTFLTGYMMGSDASKPGDLGPSDDGFRFAHISTTGIVERWSGAAWHFNQGITQATFANRPAIASSDGGYMFEATDMGNQAWIPDTVGDWVLLEGWGGPMQGTLSPDQKPALTTFDVGFRFYSTDFKREFRWGGAAWADSPGQDSRTLVAMFDSNPGAGWVLIDGLAHTISTSLGGTTTRTDADYTAAFLKQGSFGGIGTFAAAGVNYASGGVALYHRA